MRQTETMLRFADGATSTRDIALRLEVARSTIQDNLKQTNAAGLTWQLQGELTDDARQEDLFHLAAFWAGARRQTEPD